METISKNDKYLGNVEKFCKSRNYEMFGKNSKMLLLVTGTDGADAPCTELKTMPQIRSTHTAGVPVWATGSLLFVAQGIVIQSVLQVTPTWLVSVP